MLRGRCSGGLRGIWGMGMDMGITFEVCARAKRPSGAGQYAYSY